jgi:hypothetical protein
MHGAEEPRNLIRVGSIASSRRFVMRGSLPTHALMLRALFGWTVVSTVRERLGLDAAEPEPALPKAHAAMRHEPGWIWIN